MIRLISVAAILLLSATALPAAAQVERGDVVEGTPMGIDPALMPELPADSNTVHRVVDQAPEYKGDLTGWLAKNMKYPLAAMEAGAEGRVVVMFTVGKDGILREAKVGRTSGRKDLDDEALRLVRAMPAWKPAMLRGQAVNASYMLPLTFKLK